jgi:hypothetical protein
MVGGGFFRFCHWCTFRHDICFVAWTAMAKTKAQTRIDEVRKLDTKEFHKLFTAPKSQILMLLDFLEKGGDLHELAENVPSSQEKEGPSGHR